MPHFSLRRFILWGSAVLAIGMTQFYIARDRPTVFARQKPKEEDSSSVMPHVNPQRTRAYNVPAVIHPRSVQWKTARLFITESSYPFTLTFQGTPGLTSTTIRMPTGHSFTEPVMIDGTIYFSIYVDDGYVLAQESATGRDRWRIAYKGVSLSPIAAANGAVYFGASNGTFHALNGATGKELWTKSQKGYVFYMASPAVANGAVYFSSTQSSAAPNVRPDGRIFALDLQTGNQLWVFKTKATIEAPAYADGTVFAGDTESYLHALDAATGQERWKFKSSGGGVTTPAIENGVVYFAANDGSLHAIDARTGLELWRNTKEPKVATNLALDKGTIYFGGQNKNLYAVDAANGQMKWVFKTSRECGSPVLAGGLVCFPTRDGVIQALDAATGAEKWKITDLHKAVLPPIIAPGSLYFLDGAGHLYAVK